MKTLATFAVCLLSCVAGQVLAQNAPMPAAPASLAPPPAQPTLSPTPAAERAAGPVTGLTSEKVKAISIGKDVGSSGKAETLRDLENLQRQVYFQELKAKARELEMAHLPRPNEGAPVSMAAPTTVAYIPPAMQPAFPGAQPSVLTGMASPPTPLPDEEPQARLLNLIVTPTRTRADVLVSGTATTVKEGDEVGAGWKVASIKASGVLVEKTMVGKELDRRAAATPSKSPRAKGGVARPAPKWIDVERTISAKLKPAEQPPITDLAPTQAAPQNGQTSGAVVPPLPPALRPADSTSVTSAVPLGPNQTLQPQSTAAAQLPRLPR
jgi:hypothetical protein